MTPSPEWRDPAPGRPLPLWASLAADVVAHVPVPQRGMSRARWAATALKVAARSPGFHATALYRLAHAARPRLWPLGRAASALLSWALRHLYGCSIAPTCRLHGGLILPHPQGLVIGPWVELGPRSQVYQHATLGGAPGREGNPRVGADARIFAGAVLSGPIRLGDAVMVGANAVVARDVPARSVVRPPAAEVAPLPEKYIPEGV